jgi:hypothetical protein
VALADVDWDAPGAETISDEFRPKLKAFMADPCWIENVGARGFAALAKKAPTRFRTQAVSVSATLAFSIESTIESVVTEILGEFIEKSADEQA